MNNSMPTNWLIQMKWTNSLRDTCVCVSSSVVSDSETPWIIACQTPLSMGFPSQENWSEGGEEKKKENWSGLPFPSPMHESEK